MKQRKDFFDIFREQQHLFEERPPRTAWRQLERRLDAHQHRSRVTMYRSLAMVAAVMGLIVVITLITSRVDQQRQLLGEAEAVPKQLEALSDSETGESPEQIVEFSRAYRDRTSGPIVEGQRGQRLVPAK